MNLKILHAPSETGGQAWSLSQAEKKLGCQSQVMVWQGSYLKYPSDFDLKLKEVGFLKKSTRLLKFFFRAVVAYDVFHFYFGRSLLPFLVDLPILKMLGKRIIFTFQGCDIRRRIVKADNFCIPHYLICPLCRRKKDWNKKMKLWWISLWADHSFVLNPDLRYISPKSNFLPYARFNLETVPPYYPDILKLTNRERPMKIVHAPTEPEVKGTKYVVAAIENLKKKGFNIDFKLLQDKSNDEAMEIIKNCDLVIDQLLMGWYGAFAVEAMTFGKPVIVSLEDWVKKFVPFFESMPVIQADPSNIESVIENLIKNPAELLEQGKRGRIFVEEYHNPQKIAQNLIFNYYGTRQL